MFTNICNICNSKFESDIKHASTQKLTKHIKAEHKLTHEEYCLKFKYNGVMPKCNCGCGNYTRFKKGVYDKYFKDHKNAMKLSKEQIAYNTKKQKEKQTKDPANIGHSVDSLSALWKKYKEDLNFSNTQLDLESKNDYRTIKRWWQLLNIATNAEIKDAAYRHKTAQPKDGGNNSQFIKIEFEKLTDAAMQARIYYSRNAKKISLQKLYFDNKIDESIHVFKKRLKEFLGDEFDTFIINKSIASSPEQNFGFILKYYFGDKNVETQFKITKYPYDFLVNKKVLIEVDGEFWHNLDPKIPHPVLKPEDIIKSNERSRLKTEEAISHGYKIFRISDKDLNDLDKLTELWSLAK